MFVIIWRYSVVPSHHERFRAAYGPGGDWSVLFEHADGYLGTELVEGVGGSDYLTIDWWDSETAFDRFMDLKGDQYRELDGRLAELTTSEELVGRGAVVRSPI